MPGRRPLPHPGVARDRGVSTPHVGPRSLAKLLDAVISLSVELDLPSVLRRIVEAGVELTGARYGALGVLDERRTALAEFITVGMDRETRRRIGPTPKGLGLLGALITDARPLRVADLQEYEGRSGFPEHHPPMGSFLGVPIRVGNEVFGNLYLTDKREGEVFTDIDEELMLGLASAAGAAISNARLFDEVQRREAAISATNDVARLVLGGADPDQTLRFIAERARVLAKADLATFALADRDDETLVIAVVDGTLSADLAGRRFQRAGSVSGAVLESGQTAVFSDLSGEPSRRQPQVREGTIGPAIFVALTAGDLRLGSVCVGRAQGSPPFGDGEVEMVRSFASQAGIALDTATKRQELGRLSVLEEQERIGRDLHDTVIQQLFGVG
ncbi:MAG: GAF domain-containing protein, partial [Acidimicrobiales bacterium]|nr:GAF domain-containing protein [Acidimicrobiales bacterium]